MSWGFTVRRCGLLGVVGGVLFVPYALAKSSISTAVITSGWSMPLTSATGTATAVHLFETPPVILVLLGLLGFAGSRRDAIGDVGDVGLSLWNGRVEVAAPDEGLRRNPPGDRRSGRVPPSGERGYFRPPAVASGMECPDCGAGTVAVRVPEDVRSYAPSEAVAVCTRCLRVHPLDDRPAETTDPGSVSDALPADADAAAALLLAGSLLESVAGNRQAIEALIEHAERAGADPVLAFERLAADPDLDPAVDLAARYRKFDQLRG